MRNDNTGCIKNTKGAICFIICLSVILLFNWFVDELFNLFTPFLFAVPLILVLTCYLIMVIQVLRQYRRNKRLGMPQQFMQLILLGAMVTLQLFFPFRDTKVAVEYLLYTPARLEVVRQIQNGTLTDTQSRAGLISLPVGKRHLSVSSEVVVYEKTEFCTQLGFFVCRGMLSPYSIVLYTSTGQLPYEWCYPTTEVIDEVKLGDNWYYVNIE